MIRYDIYNQFKDSSCVAYCYKGQYFGSLAFYDNTNDSVMIFIPQGYYMSETLVTLSEIISKEQFNEMELWEYIHEIDDLEIKQEALNRLSYAYNTFYPEKEFIRTAKFKGFNDEII
ncbi:hypothetical protein AB3N02_22620 [Priestia aryabhattai]|uniref:hypothetical protein n=1 Tax=Priestia aryabhattai TaxID=412384 RepID=UPI0039A1A8F8